MRTRSRTRSRSSRSTPPRTSTDSPLLLAGDFSEPVYRHLAERAWRKDGDLAILVRLAPSPPRPARLRACADLPPHPTDAARHADARHPRPPRRHQALGRRAAHGRRLDHRAGLVHQARRRASFRPRPPSFVQVLTLYPARRLGKHSTSRCRSTTRRSACTRCSSSTLVRPPFPRLFESFIERTLERVADSSELPADVPDEFNQTFSTFAHLLVCALLSRPSLSLALPGRRRLTLFDPLQPQHPPLGHLVFAARPLLPPLDPLLRPAAPAERHALPPLHGPPLRAVGEPVALARLDLARGVLGARVRRSAPARAEGHQLLPPEVGQGRERHLQGRPRCVPSLSLLPSLSPSHRAALTTPAHGPLPAGRPEPRYGRPPKMDFYAGRPPKYEVV